MIKLLTSILIVLTIFFTLGEVESCTISECESPTSIDFCLLCNHCSTVEITTLEFNLKENLFLNNSPYPLSLNTLIERNLPYQIFRPPIS